MNLKTIPYLILNYWRKSMDNIQVLRELEKDYDFMIQSLHEQTINNYNDLCTARNKRQNIRNLIKEISGK